MKNQSSIIKWLSLALFILGFCIKENFISISAIPASSSVFIMVAAMGLVLFFSRAVGWLGLVLFVGGLALMQGWISLNLGQFTLSGLWIMAGGFLTTWFNSK